MKKLIQLNLLLLLISSATAQEAQPLDLLSMNLPSRPQELRPQESQSKEKVLRDYDWKDLAQQQKLPGEVISMDGGSVLKIERTNDFPQDLLVMKISDPAIIKKAYFLVCTLKYENVSATGPSLGFARNSYLHLSCFIPPATVAGDGTILDGSAQDGAGIRGTSDWRPAHFVVVRDALEGLPTKLELHLILQSHGTIYIRPIRIYGVAGSWWTSEQAGLIGGIGGALIGCFGGLIGLLAGKGKARNFVLGAVKFSIALGILLIIGGLVAMTLKQPYAVWYALLLPGVILVLVFSLNLHSIQRRYDELEIRRMTSVDTMGS
jgi:hypothetical protein